MKMVRSKYGVKSIRVKPHAINNSLYIDGPDLPGVQVKQVRKKPPRFETGTEQIPNDFHILQYFVNLTADLIFVNGVLLLTTLSRKIRLVTAEHITTVTAKQLGSSLTKVVNLYARGGSLVNIILMDQDFIRLKNNYA